MVTPGDLIFITGFCIVARMVGKEYVLIPAILAMVDTLSPVRGAFVGAIGVIIMGLIGRITEVS